MHSSDTISRRPGRPRAFDMEAALDAAIGVFSETGYSAASITDLGQAMGLSAGSIYKAFPDKRAVFIAAFDRYKQKRDALLAAVLEEPGTGRDKLRRALEFYADAAHGASGRRGCLVVGTAAELALFDAEIAARVARAMERNQATLAGLLREGQADGSISPTLDVPTTARALLFVQQGMRVYGKTGPDRDTMLATVAVAMKLID